MLFFAHIPFVVNRTFNAVPTGRLQHYELLTYLSFPLITLDAIIERRNNLVELTCVDRETAEKFVFLLKCHPNVHAGCLFDSELIDVKLS